MSEPYLAEIRMFGFSFAPSGWAQCNGQSLPIDQNQAMFSLLSTTYGGNGRTDFNLPDLRARVPMHKGSGFPLGDFGGEESHTLADNETPSHTHQLRGVNVVGDVDNPNGNALAQAFYHTDTSSNLTALAPSTISASTGGNSPFDITMPSLVVNFCIAMTGTFPPRN
ncbi:phage tail protein [Candidatus Entotheonella palauensis]|uniref:Microcystin dependent protein n=1 Tax=Candidatus Entotheonella gemina TaxID=1429439 RepID=W4MC36_9BACT|nr:tail fiber protein [Candidatus Entotheonella palauensis]ETX07758.1 MAG: microcystin dependent protein [Candidatus Entotheonella gemina]